MDEKEYLAQIAREGRQTGSQSKLQKLLLSKVFIVGAIGAALFVILMIIGAILGNKGDETTSVYALKLRIDNVAAAVSEYRPSLVSSELDSSSVSLAGVLETTSRDLGEHLSGKVNPSKDDALIKLAQDSTSEWATVQGELARAKTNGTLDRVYAGRITEELSKIMNAEVKLASSTGTATLKSVLTQSYNSLNNLYDKFSSFK